MERLESKKRKDWKCSRTYLWCSNACNCNEIRISVWYWYAKVIFMLAIHELGETVIGDLTQFQISREEKERIEHEAVRKILRGLIDGEQIERIFLEFDAHKTAEAKFAYMCDKLECDLQCKLYDEEGCVDLNDQEDNETAANSHVKALLESEKTWSGMWLKFGQEKYPYDENFMAVSKYAMKNTLSRCIKSTTVI